MNDVGDDDDDDDNAEESAAEFAVELVLESRPEIAAKKQKQQCSWKSLSSSVLLRLLLTMCRYWKCSSPRLKLVE